MDEEDMFIHQSREKLLPLNKNYPVIKSNPKLYNVSIKLLKIAQSNVPKNQKHQLAVYTIILHTSDSAEQLVLLKFFYKCLGIEQAYKYCSLRCKRNYRFVSNEERKKIRELRKQGYSYLKIAKTVNRPVSTVYYNCKRKYKLLSKREIQKIKELRKQGYSYYKIAKILNRHVSTIYYYCKRNNI